LASLVALVAFVVSLEESGSAVLDTVVLLKERVDVAAGTDLKIVVLALGALGVKTLDAGSAGRDETDGAFGGTGDVVQEEVLFVTKEALVLVADLAVLGAGFADILRVSEVTVFTDILASAVLEHESFIAFSADTDISGVANIAAGGALNTDSVEVNFTAVTLSNASLGLGFDEETAVAFSAGFAVLGAGKASFVRAAFAGFGSSISEVSFTAVLDTGAVLKEESVFAGLAFIEGGASGAAIGAGLAGLGVVVDVVGLRAFFNTGSIQ
jgi:hypothetical protein